MAALDPDNGKRLGELRPFAGVGLDHADQIVAMPVNQIFQRTRSDRRTVVARRPGLSQSDEEFDCLGPTPLDDLVNKVSSGLGSRWETHLKSLAFFSRAARKPLVVPPVT
jgi:hypothetical protein